MVDRTPVEVRVKHHFKASPERVFDAWLDPAKAKKFLFATPDGEMVRAEIDPRVGGHYSIVERRDGEDVEHLGEYLEIERPHRLVFTCQVPFYSEQIDRVTIEIEPVEDGCILTITTRTTREWADPTADGWKMILENLASRDFLARASS